MQPLEDLQVMNVVEDKALTATFVQGALSKAMLFLYHETTLCLRCVRTKTEVSQQFMLDLQDRNVLLVQR